MAENVIKHPRAFSTPEDRSEAQREEFAVRLDTLTVQEAEEIYAALKPDEIAVLQMSAQGLTQKEMAREIDTSDRWVRTLLKTAHEKLAIERASEQTNPLWTKCPAPLICTTDLVFL